MIFKANKTTIYVNETNIDEVRLSRLINSKMNYIAIKIDKQDSFEFVQAKIERLVAMEDNMFIEMCRIAKYETS